MFRKNITFTEAELEVLGFWKKNNTFKSSLERNKNKKRFVFYDGPPFATGLPHYGHILSGTIKDTIGRFYHQLGFDVPRRFGWDCHGLPVEYEIDKQLGITDRKQVLDMGIAKYNDECKSIVMKYSSEWESTVLRMGRWVDFKNGYKTMDPNFMESVWYVFKQLFTRDKVYKGYKIMPFSTACKTPLSNFEANQNYKDVSDPSVLIAFPLKEKFKNFEVSLVAWTTTPWTLPSNCALAVNRDFTYDIFLYKGFYYIMHTDRISSYLKGYKVVGQLKGAELVGLDYEQPFDYFESDRSRGFFKVQSAKFVSDSNGTAIVHCAPAFGEDDYNMFIEKGLITEKDDVPCPVDENGKFTIGKYKGVYFKDMDKFILNDIKSKVLINSRVVHSYPFCWRSDTPLMYRLVPSWFIKVSDHREDLLRTNDQTTWVPADIKTRRFGNWLANARDWLVSRNRFWGTPMPIWVNEDNDYICIGSIAELEEYSGVKVTDIHRQFVDHIVIKKDGKEYRRIDEVFDCWFESGSMPYAQDHYPFDSDLDEQVKNLDLGEKYLKMDNFPGDFIGEGIDQTRGWFYTLHVISTLLFDKPAFKNVIVNGIVLAEDGKKMSKRLKNYPDPNLIFDKYGADSLRMYLLNSPVVESENLRFSESGVHGMLKNLLIPWYNSLVFTMDCSKSESRLEMDSWIDSRLSNLTYNVVTQMENYRLNGILNLALKFIDDLSNWYIRINRAALKKNGGHLYYILEQFSIIMASFCPFFSEYCYQSVSKKLESVHFEEIIKGTPVIHPFDTTKKVIESIRQLRESHQISLKTPLKLATVVCDADTMELLKEYVNVIKSECNLLNILFENESKYAYTFDSKPNYMSLRENKSTIKKKSSIINSFTEQECKGLFRDGCVEKDGFVFTKADVIINKKFVGIEDSGYFDNYGVIIDKTTDEVIIELKNAREMFSFIQRLRKSCGLLPDDEVMIDIGDNYLKEITNKHYPQVILGKEGNMITEGKHLFEGKEVEVQIFRK